MQAEYSYIQPLSQTPFPELMRAFHAAFANYFVKLPESEEYWRARFRAARVDWDLSYGFFENGWLCGFIIHGIDDFQGVRTAYNTGTGVIPLQREQKLVDRLYDHALPRLRAAGVQQCTLEVITENARAIRVYERIGFQRRKQVHCFSGTLPIVPSPPPVLAVDFGVIAGANPALRALDSWDNSDAAIRAGQDGYETFLVGADPRAPLGYFVVNRQSGYVPRLHAYHDWPAVLGALAAIQRTIRINNLDERLTTMMDALRAAGLVNHINQYEMHMAI